MLFKQIKASRMFASFSGFNAIYPQFFRGCLLPFSVYINDKSSREPWVSTLEVLRGFRFVLE